MLGEIFSETGVIVLLVVLIVLFGGSQLPKLARSLGSAKKEFKEGMGTNAAPSDAGNSSSNKSDS